MNKPLSWRAFRWRRARASLILGLFRLVMRVISGAWLRPPWHPGQQGGAFARGGGDLHVAADFARPGLHIGQAMAQGQLDLAKRQSRARRPRSPAAPGRAWSTGAPRHAAPGHGVAILASASWQIWNRAVELLAREINQAIFRGHQDGPRRAVGLELVHQALQALLQVIRRGTGAGAGPGYKSGYLGWWRSAHAIDSSILLRASVRIFVRSPCEHNPAPGPPHRSTG